MTKYVGTLSLEIPSCC